MAPFEEGDRKRKRNLIRNLVSRKRKASTFKTIEYIVEPTMDTQESSMPLLFGRPTKLALVHEVGGDLARTATESHNTSSGTDAMRQALDEWDGLNSTSTAKGLHARAQSGQSNHRSNWARKGDSQCEISPGIPRSNSSASTSRGSVFSDPNTCPTYCTSPVPSPLFARLDRKHSVSSRGTTSGRSQTTSSDAVNDCCRDHERPKREVQEDIQQPDAKSSSKDLSETPRKEVSFVIDASNSTADTRSWSIRKSAEWVEKLEPPFVHHGSSEDQLKLHQYTGGLADSTMLLSSPPDARTKAERRKVKVALLNSDVHRSPFLDTQFQAMTLISEDKPVPAPHEAPEINEKAVSPASESSTYLFDSSSELSISETSGGQRDSYMSSTVDVGDVVVHALEGMNKKIVERVMEEMRMMFDAGDGLRSHTAGGIANSGEQTGAWVNDSSRPSSWGVSNKRALNGGNSELPNDDQPEDERGKRPKRVHDSVQQDPMKLRYACPFFKRCPGNNKRWPSCAGPGWVSVHRVKEHVYRRHPRPLLCSRCYEEFNDDEELAAHTRIELPCRIVYAPPQEVEGFSKDQERRLRSRKRPSGKTERDRWIDMYQILFPQDPEDSIPDPYYEADSINDKHLSTGSEEFARYQEFSRTELPRLVQQNIETWIQQRSATLEEDLKSGLPELVRNCQETLFQSFRQHSTIEARPSTDPSDAPMAINRLECVIPQSPIPEGHIVPSQEQIGRLVANAGSHTITADSGYSSIGYPMVKHSSATSTSGVSMTTVEMDLASSQGEMSSQTNVRHSAASQPSLAHDQSFNSHSGRPIGLPGLAEKPIHNIIDFRDYLVDSSPASSNHQEMEGLYGQASDFDFTFFDDISTCDSHFTPSRHLCDIVKQGHSGSFVMGPHQQ